MSDAYYAYIDQGPKPSIAVIQDLDGNNGYGCLWGEVNSNIHKGFGCEGVITDGGVRDVPDIAPGFQMLAASVLPSHAYVHVVDYARPVDVAGMRVMDGDIIHADQHGAVVIPADVIAEVKGAAEQLARREAVIIQPPKPPALILKSCERLRETRRRYTEPIRLWGERLELKRDLKKATVFLVTPAAWFPDPL